MVRYGHRWGKGNVVALLRFATYEGFQRAEQLRDALEEAGPEQFFLGEACTDGVVPQSQEVDVWVVSVEALQMRRSLSAFVLFASSIPSFLLSHQQAAANTNDSRAI